jgi:hypothetical protein
MKPEFTMCAMPDSKAFLKLHIRVWSAAGHGFMKGAAGPGVYR